MKPYFSDERVQVWHGDCREFLPELGVVEVESPPPKKDAGDYRPLGIPREVWAYYRRTYGKTVH